MSWRLQAGQRSDGGRGGRRGAGPADDRRWQRARGAGRRWAAWGLALGAVTAAVANAPAQWLADGLRQGSGERLLLADARGSLWRGSAVLVLTGGAGSRDASALPGRLQWRLRPGWQGLQLSASHDCCLNGELQLLLQPQRGGVTLRLAGSPAPGMPGGRQAAAPRPLGQWPAAWLAGLGTPWNTLQLGGVLQVASAGLALQAAQGGWQLDGALVVELLGASSRLSPLPVLGSYRLLLQGGGAGEGATLRLDSLDGALLLSGSGRWTGSRLHFRGEARAAEGDAAALSNLLNIIGRRQGALSVIAIG